MSISRKGSHPSQRIVLGLMSGTSADGVDAVAVRITGRGERMRADFLLHHYARFTDSLRERLLAVMAPAVTSTEEIARLHADLGNFTGRVAQAAIRRLGPAHRPILIGLAGQTICHLPDRRAGRTVTLQIGEAARVAARTGLPVVSDFRQTDVAAGGQGAPLVPWTDWVLFRHPRIGRAVQNIGGVGNVTWIPPGAQAGEVVAFDTGPGNMIIDGLVSMVSRGRERFDRDGRRASRGRVLEGVLGRWLSHPYFKLRPPKTTGRELFGRPFVEREIPMLRAASRRPDDWIATATAFTARSIAHAYSHHLRHFNISAKDEGGVAAIVGKPGRKRAVSTEVILCGGGAHNPALVAMLVAELPGILIRPIDAYGIPAQAKEALSFGLLAAAFRDGVPGNLPQVTGARHPTILGRLVLPVA